MRNIILLCFFALSSVIYSQKHITIAPGAWNNPDTWQNGNVPGYTFSDTVFVNHRVVFDSILSVYGYFRIDERGGICGQHLLYVYNKMDVFGFFWVDSLDIFGGDVLQMSAEICKSTKGVLIHSAGASFSIQEGESFMAGVAFDCASEFSTLSILENGKTINLVIYPNPTSDFINFELNMDELVFVLYDYAGKSIFHGKANSKIDLTGFESGIYFLNILKDEVVIQTEKVVKE